MTERNVMGARTYLEMRDPSQLARAPLPDADWRIDRVLDCPPVFWRFLYTEVGRDHLWVDRLPWSPDDIRDYLADSNVTLWLLIAWGAPAGYCELRQDDDEGVEIAYFGLLQEFLGRGLGKHLLTEAATDPVSGMPEFKFNKVWVRLAAATPATSLLQAAEAP